MHGTAINKKEAIQAHPEITIRGQNVKMDKPDAVIRQDEPPTSSHHPVIKQSYDMRENRPKQKKKPFHQSTW